MCFSNIIINIAAIITNTTIYLSTVRYCCSSISLLHLNTTLYANITIQICLTLHICPINVCLLIGAIHMIWVMKCRLRPYPSLYETFMIKDGVTWRPPAVNETCCIRPHLADTLHKIAADGPDVLYTGQAGQVVPDPVFQAMHIQLPLSMMMCFAFKHISGGQNTVPCLFDDVFCSRLCIDCGRVTAHQMTVCVSRAQQNMPAQPCVLRVESVHRSLLEDLLCHMRYVSAQVLAADLLCCM